jgi:small redox-active disulfide protein 2
MIISIKILGAGCTNCKNLEKNVFDALAELNIAADVEKVEDIQKIMSYGIMRTPGLVISEKIILAGRVPSVNELKTIIQKAVDAQ